MGGRAGRVLDGAGNPGRSWRARWRFFGDIPREQIPAQNRAGVECAASYPVDPRLNMVLPTKRAEAQYRYLAEVLRPCVESEGYIVAEPPSEQRWLDDYYGGGDAWDPFTEAASQVPSPGSELLDWLYRTCPPVSESVYPPLSY